MLNDTHCLIHIASHLTLFNRPASMLTKWQLYCSVRFSAPSSSRTTVVMFDEHNTPLLLYRTATTGGQLKHYGVSRLICSPCICKHASPQGSVCRCRPQLAAPQVRPRCQRKCEPRARMCPPLNGSRSPALVACLGKRLFPLSCEAAASFSHSRWR